jgi:membrane protein
MRFWIALLREAWSDYQRHNAAWMAAALAYFAAFAIAPLIIVLVEIAGFFVHSHRHVLDLIFAYLRRDIGTGSDAVQQIVTARMDRPRGNLLSQIVGWTIFVVAAAGLFASLQFALNTVWGVNRRGLREAARQRILGFVMMLIVAALLLVSVIANAAITAASFYLARAGLATLVQFGDFALTFVLVWLLFGLLFWYLPNARIGWRDVWLGAILTALLFTIGQMLLGWYIGSAGLTSAYGAFGSLIAFLIWANYTAQIFLFGAEFTHVYARRHGTRSNL